MNYDEKWEMIVAVSERARDAWRDWWEGEEWFALFWGLGMHQRGEYGFYSGSDACF